jgi:hypothetical protein
VGSQALTSYRLSKRNARIKLGMAMDSYHMFRCRSSLVVSHYRIFSIPRIRRFIRTAELQPDPEDHRHKNFIHMPQIRKKSLPKFTLVLGLSCKLWHVSGMMKQRSKCWNGWRCRGNCQVLEQCYCNQCKISSCFYLIIIVQNVIFCGIP